MEGPNLLVDTHSVELLGVSSASSIREVIAAIDKGGIGIALVLDAEGRLEATVTDGDVRRGLLRGLGLSSLISELLAHRDQTGRHSSVTAPILASRSEILSLMKSHVLRHVPLVDDQGVVRKIVTLQELVLEDEREVRGLIMAGGLGKRLRPLTLDVPKPMLKLGDRPILEHVLVRLRSAGIQKIDISTHYMAEKIREHFSDGSALGLDIKYLHETEPLGTAGALGNISDKRTPVLLMNGDILTDVDFKAMHTFHREQGAALTVGVGIQETTVPFGVVECDGVRISRITEKPTIRMMINSGIYLIEPEAYSLVQPGRPIDMPDLIRQAMQAGMAVIAFPLREGWIDIGSPEDYQRAQALMAVDEAGQERTMNLSVGNV